MASYDYYSLTPVSITKDTFTDDAFAKLKEYPLSVYMTVVPKAGRSFVLKDENIITGSFELRRDGVSGNSLEIGTAISSELNFTVDNDIGTFNSVSFEGATITASVLWYKSVTEAYSFQLGIFYVDEPPRLQRAIKISALDGMVKLDKPYPSTAWPGTATLGNILADACTDCGVTLITPTDTLIDTTLDGFTVAAYPEGDLITYRDIIRWVCGLTFTCARMTHEGKLELTWFNVPNDYQFTDTSHKYASIGDDMRFSSDLYESEARITALSYGYIDDGEPKTQEGSLYDPANFDYTLYIKDNMLANGAGLSLLVPTLVFLQRFGDPADPQYDEGDPPQGPFLFRAFNCNTIPMPHIWPFDKISFRRRNQYPEGFGTAGGLPSGLGTEEDPYCIESGAELNTIRIAVNNDSTDKYGTHYKSAYYRVMRDLDLSAYNPWTPIGTNVNKFSGVFDGNGCKIYGVKHTNTNTANGLFGYVNNGTIKNVGIETGQYTTYWSGAILAIYVAGTSVIENCYNKIDISVDGSGGGISVGCFANQLGSGSTIQNCINYGDMTAIDQDVGFGGIVYGGYGTSYGSVDKCVYCGVINARAVSASAFGVISTTDNLVITDCYYDSTIQSSSNILINENTTGLTTAELTGSDAVDNATALDFNLIWDAVPETYPTLKIIVGSYTVYCTNSVFRLNGNTTIEGRGETTEKAKYAKLSSFTPTARAALSTTDVGAMVLNNNKPLWGKEATGGELISMLRMSTADNIVLGSTVQDGNTIINGKAEVRFYIGGNLECTISDGSIVLNGICTIDSTGIKNVGGTYKVTW